MRYEFKWSALFVVGVLTICASLTLGWVDGIWAATVLVACILMHEAAHITTAHSFAVCVKALGASAKGAYTIRERSGKRAIEILITLAGPLMNLLLFAVFATFPGKAATWIAAGNLILAVGNLIPLAPSDGWRIWKLLTDA